MHSFTGTKDEVKEYLEMNLYIGINGCSLKTTENLEVVESIPITSIMLETDAPWCGIKKTHAGYHYISTEFDTVKKAKNFVIGKCVKDRCEPCHMRQVLEVVSGVLGMDEEALASKVHENTEDLFFKKAS